MSREGISALALARGRAGRIVVCGLAVLAGLAPSPAPAASHDDSAGIAPDLSREATLADVLALTEAANPGLQAAHDRWSAARERVPQASSLPDPKLSYTYFLEPVETRVGPQRQKFGVSQMLPLFGKRGLRGDVARLEADVAEARRDAAAAELRFRVTRRWNDYYYLGRAIVVTEENVRLLRHLESVALTRYAAGKAPHATVIRAQLELGKLEDRLRTLSDRRHPALAALNAEMNRSPGEPIAWPREVARPDQSLNDADLDAAMRAWNPLIRELRLTVKRNDAAARLAGRSPLPDLMLGAEIIDTGEAAMPGTEDSGKNAAMATASVNVPLWLGRYRAEEAEARARRSAAERELAQATNRLTAELERVRYELRDAERRVDLYEHTLLPKARQSLEVMEDAFTAGEVSFLDLVDAQRTFLEFELAFERALADRASGLAALERIAGPVVTAGTNGE